MFFLVLTFTGKQYNQRPFSVPVFFCRKFGGYLRFQRKAWNPAWPAIPITVGNLKAVPHGWWMWHDAASVWRCILHELRLQAAFILFHPRPLATLCPHLCDSHQLLKWWNKPNCGKCFSHRNPIVSPWNIPIPHIFVGSHPGQDQTTPWLADPHFLNPHVHVFRKAPFGSAIWVWINTYIDTIFSGLFTSINPSYDLGFTRGTRVLTHPHLEVFIVACSISMVFVVYLQPLERGPNRGPYGSYVLTMRFETPSN